MQLPRLAALDSTLLVIDVQDKLLAYMPDAKGLVRDIAFLIDAARLLDVPVLATEQYPKGLGPTTRELACRLPPELPTKVAFSSCGAPGVMTDLRKSGRPNVVLAGMETHVCVMQTALDLLASDFRVFLPIDAVSSQFRLDQDTALHRVKTAGAVLTTVEATVFEWLGGADHPKFKAVSALVKSRSAERRARS